MATAFFCGCAHHTTPAQTLSAGVAPFTQSRDQVILIVTAAKRSLGAEDLNSLAVAYTPLEEKANAYAHFLVESVRMGAFDANQNAVCATNLTLAITKFNVAFAQIYASRKASSEISSSWVAPFSATVASDWAKYNPEVNAAPAQTKADLIEELKVKTLWPNYEDIATEPLATPSPR
ncbi:MAG: hypothetical protein JOZ77_12605 [Candidatus Eremiobacteraeota bacterium]|nr:hypothetical protein [Candidatus Eremiobacteraeota bacterium]